MGRVIFQGLVQPVQTEMFLFALKEKMADLEEGIRIREWMLSRFPEPLVDPFRAGHVLMVLLEYGIGLFGAALGLKAMS